MDELFAALEAQGNVIRNVRIEDGQTFAPDPNGQPAMIVGVDDGDKTYDATAYMLHEPERWWLALGSATCLGEAAIRRASETGDPIELVETPRRWLERTTCAGGRFACLLRWDIDPRLNLGWVRTVHCETDRLRDRLEVALTRFRVPFIIETANSAAATTREARRAA